MDRDFLSARQVALTSGTTIPRVKRAIARLEFDVREDPNGRVRLSPKQVKLLRRSLGTTPAVPELSRTEALVLAALSRSPFGLISSRVVARRAGVSPTAAGLALRTLRTKGLATVERRSMPGTHIRERQIIKANLKSPRWPSIAEQLAQVHPAIESGPPAHDRTVPARLGHLFWNTAPTQMSPRLAGGYIARRLLTAGDPEGLAWGSEQLTAKDWRHAAATRGISPRRHALALNLAAQARRSRVQFLGARGQINLEQPIPIAGIRVLGLSDILAMKVKVIGDRGELRDYFDLKRIEQMTGRTFEEGLGLYMSRYGVKPEDASIMHIVTALGYLDDVDEDDLLPESKQEIAQYWTRRQPEVIRNLSRFGASPTTGEKTVE
jgi:DNA-binding MarR family transcriptional regulator